MSVFGAVSGAHEKGAISPMPGKLIKVNVKHGDVVKKGFVDLAV